MRIRIFTSLFIALIGTTTATQLEAAPPVPDWRVSFGDAGRPDIDPINAQKLVSNGAGDFFSYFADAHPATIAAKIDGGGAVLWSVAPRPFVSSYPSKAIALQDGSLVVLASDIRLYMPDGRLAWIHASPKQDLDGMQVSEIAGELVLANGAYGGLITRIDRFSGLILESIPANLYSSCGNGIKTAAAGESIYYSGCGVGIRKFSVHPLRRDWLVIPVPENSGLIQELTADDSGAYFSIGNNEQSVIYKLADHDGSLIWTNRGDAGSLTSLRLDTDGDLLAFRETSLRKLDRHTGTVRWAHASPGPISDIAASADGIYTTGNGSAALPSVQPGFIERLNRYNGQSDWQIPLSTATAGTLNVSDIVVHADRVLAAGATCPTTVTHGKCEPVLWSTTSVGTAAAEHAPLYPMQSRGRATLAVGDDTLAAAIESGAEGQQISVKRISNSNGHIQWQVTYPVALTRAEYLLYEDVDIHANAHGSLVVAYKRLAESQLPGIADTVVFKLDANTGERVWQRSLLEHDGFYTDLHAAVDIDDAGNVYAAIHEKALDTYVTLGHRRQLRKFAAASGTEITRIEMYPFGTPHRSYFTPPAFRLSGNGIFLDEPSPPSKDFGLRRIDGASGQLTWFNPDFFLGYGEYFGTSTVCSQVGENNAHLFQISCIDLQSGNVLWTQAFGEPGTTQPYVWNIGRTPDGDLLVHATYQTSAGGSTTRQQPLLLRLNGKTGAVVWANRFDDYLPERSWISEFKAIQNDVLYISRNLSVFSVNDHSILSGVSLQDGSIIGTQYFGASSPGNNLDEQQLYLDTVGLAENDGLITSSHRVIPGEPMQFHVEKWAPPQTFQGGSLRVELSPTATLTPQGKTQVQFVFDTINDGTILAPSVQAVLSLPYPIILGEVGCDISGVACLALKTSTTVELTTDIAAGQRLRLSGTFQASGAIELLLARAFSPYGFVEMNLYDNYSKRSYEISLFRNGFE